LVDISENGVRLATKAELHSGSKVMLTLPLDGTLADATKHRALHLSVTVLTTMPGNADDGMGLRCEINGFNGAGSYQALQRLVFAAQRERVAEERDSHAAPMASTSDRRAAQAEHADRPARFSKSSVSPLFK
jgi:hypothetical protein